MPFIGPWFLMGMLGLVGVAIPIVLHFFFRSRYRTVMWGAMEFLLAAIEQTSRRLKFQELLLLILRCAVLFFLALALARPAFSLVAGSGGRDAVDAVFVIDSSFSMGGREGAKTRFELAKAAALNAIDQLPPHSTVQIFTCGTAVSDPLLREPANLDQARKVIDKLELTQQATDLGPGLVEAVKALDLSRAPNKELYLFSDMQMQGLARSSGEIYTQLDHAKSLATIYFVRCGTRELATAAILSLTPQTGIPRPEQRVGFAVEVRNTGASAIRQLQVSLTVDGVIEGAETQTIPELPVGDKRIVPLMVRFDKAGLRIVTAFLGNDDLRGDNYLDRVLLVRDKVKVLVVDGNLNGRAPERSASYFLVNALHALTPSSDPKKTDHYLQTEVISPRQAGGELLKDKALCILVNVPISGDAFAEADGPTKEFTDSLADFVRKGGGLLIYGGDRVKAEAYNKTLGDPGLLPVPLTATQTFPVKDEIGLDRASAMVPGFEHFRTDDHYDKMSAFPIIKSVGQEEPGLLKAKGATPERANAARVIFRYTNGKPAIVTRKVGFGEVMFVGTAADPAFVPGTHDPSWHWLHLWGQGYVPLVEAKINYLLNSQSQSHNLTVGEALRYVPPDDWALRSFILIEPGDRAHAKMSLLPEGPRIPLGLAKKEWERPLVLSPSLLKAGVYWLTTRDSPADDRKPFAVAADLRESADLQTLSNADIDRQLDFTPVHVTVKEGAPAHFAAERTNREWTGLLLWLVMAMAVSESLLAWFCGRAW